MLADSVGLGKTYVALAVAAEYSSVNAVVPALLKPQWLRVSASLKLHIRVFTHESMSRRTPIPPSALVVVDEAHRLRNPATNRYDHVSRSIRNADVLLITATPVVNRAADLANLLRLCIADDALAVMGVPSLESAAKCRDMNALAFAVAPIVVARSVTSLRHQMSRWPCVRDGPVIRAPPLADAKLKEVVRTIDALRFPTFGSTNEAGLLRAHMLHRLSSSAAACRETVRRHIAYVLRARQAVIRGKMLSRALAGRIFSSEDELQLDLGDWTERERSRCVPVSVLSADLERLRAVLRTLSDPRESAPKVQKLQDLLRRRTAQKTIVFTTALATAWDVARHTGWKAAAVVGSGRSWIASGPIGVSETLSLFAPEAAGLPRPPPSKVLDTLIATDLVSEGLNLQDADAIVHYDLPWTPLRLEQRLGRIARMRSPHRQLSVYWFGVHPVIERRLRIEQAIMHKVDCQLGLGVVATSRVGRARVINLAFAEREAIGRIGRALTDFANGYAVVHGPMAAAASLVWQRGSIEIPELIVLAGTPPQQTRDFRTMRQTLEALVTAPDCAGEPPWLLQDALANIVHARLAATNRGPTNADAVRLSRTIVKHGYSASRRGDTALLAALDAALDRVQTGLPVGAERALADLLRANLSTASLRAWLDAHQPSPSDFPTFRIAAAIFGDGSRG